ncbi:Ribonuclease II [Forsythia ovata]|uniref:Ribonuclease II n=1 Tax=Forsythia ovata TaxID=205694 RepID=A0ABD1QDZ8_9LAMI
MRRVLMGIPDNPFAALKKLRPNNDDENYEKQQIIHHHVTLTVNCPSCKKSFNGWANLTDDTTKSVEEGGGGGSPKTVWNSPQKFSLELKSSEELLENKSGKRMLQKGLLLEFKKDPDRVLLAVAQKHGVKKKWMNGAMTSIKPQQSTFIVLGVENFDYTEILDFVQRVQSNLMIFGSAESLESYCVHLLLSKDNIYFTVLESKCSFSVYGPRLAVQAAEKELKEFVKLLKSAREMPSHSKPAKSSWRTEEKIRHRIESLEAYAIDKYYILPGLMLQGNGWDWIMWQPCRD